MGTIFVLFLVFRLVIYTGMRFLRSPERKPDAAVVVSYLTCLLAWAILTAVIARRNGYVDTTAYFGMNLATFVPFAITGLFILWPKSRKALRRWIESISIRELTWIHVLRIAAIGTIVKMLSGALPNHFILPVIPESVPKLLRATHGVPE